MIYFINLLICSLLIISVEVSAQDQSQPLPESNVTAEKSSVEVVGVKDPELKSYANMLKGVKGFKDLIGVSPNAKLRFRLIANDSSVDFKAITLRLASDNISVAIPLSNEGFFTLDEALAPAGEDVDLILNLKKNLLRWRPDVRTSNLPENVRRLGDLRLECEVRWAIEKEDMSFIKRNGFRILGGPCNSSRISPIFIADSVISSARLVTPSRDRELSLQVNGMFYTLPLHDKDWPHDSMVEFIYK